MKESVKFVLYIALTNSNFDRKEHTLAIDYHRNTCYTMTDSIKLLGVIIMNKAIMHINYGELEYDSFGKNTVDNIFKMAAEIGFDGIEFRGKQPKELESISFREYIDQIVAAKKKYGLSDILFGFFVSGCRNPDKEIREKNMLEVLEKVKIVNELCGTTLCNCNGSNIISPISTAPRRSYEFHGSAAATQQDWDLTVDTFQKIGRELEKLGVTFAFETHMFRLHDLPAASKKLVDLIDSPAIGLNLDYGNMVLFPGVSPVEDVIDLFGEKLYYVHLKNSSPVSGGQFRIATSLADGSINNRLFLEKLRDVGFTGPIGIEAPRDGDKMYFAKQDFEYYKSIAKSL